MKAMPELSKTASTPATSLCVVVAQAVTGLQFSNWSIVMPLRRHLVRELVLPLIVSVVLTCVNTLAMAQTPNFDAMKMLPALAWLDSNKNKYALASNRFESTAEARKFVVELFRRGAVQVYVADPMEEESRIKAEGGPYADTLVVELPADSAKRAALFKLFAVEAGREGFEPEYDTGQKLVLLWWD
jgi:hypothetical protein